MQVISSSCCLWYLNWLKTRFGDSETHVILNSASWILYSLISTRLSWSRSLFLMGWKYCVQTRSRPLHRGRKRRQYERHLYSLQAQEPRAKKITISNVLAKSAGFVGFGQKLFRVTSGCHRDVRCAVYGKFFKLSASLTTFDEQYFRKYQFCDHLTTIIFENFPVVTNFCRTSECRRFTAQYQFCCYYFHLEAQIHSLEGRL